MNSPGSWNLSVKGLDGVSLVDYTERSGRVVDTEREWSFGGNIFAGVHLTLGPLLLGRWIRARDAEAFRELVIRHASVVFATARRILGDPERAEDVTQDCFLKLVEASREPQDLSAWLHRVAANRSPEVLRSEE